MRQTKPKIAIVRGKFLNPYEMQIFAPLVNRFELTAFGSLRPFGDRFGFPVVKLPSPLDLPEFPYKMAVLNRLFIDAHYLFGLEAKLKGFDLVHSAETYYHYTQQALNAKRKGYVKKVIATVLENIPANNEGIWGRRAFKARARRELDHLIALTNLTKEVLVKEGADPRKITVISHGIDTRRFRPAQDLEARLGPKTSTFRILFSGRLEVYKGVFEILEAAKILLSDPETKHLRLEFIFVGEGSEKKNLLAKEAELGLINFTKHREVSYEEMPQIYQEVEIFVAPSKASATWQEQYNTALLEAQAAGLPIVTTRSGGIPENVGQSAVMVEPGNAITLASSLKNFLLSATLRLEYSRLARNRAVRVHDNRLIADKLAALYTSVLGLC